MKIAIIGKGTSSIITSLVFLKKGHSIDVYFDPNQNHINVGESTTPNFGTLINDVLGITIHDLVDYGIGSIKSGIKFIDWGNTESFRHNFCTNQIAFHFENKKFNPFINGILKERNLVNFIPKKVERYNYNSNNTIEINNITYDFVVFCSGWNNSNDYITPIFSTVNTAILYKENTVDVDPLHTIHRATEDGWQFGLPFPKENETKCGYLFDRNLVSVDEVKIKLNKKDIYETLEWTPRYAKNLINNNCIAFNGNNLFFIEPLQALTLFYSIRYAEMLSEYLDNRTLENFHRINHLYQYEIWTYQLSLAYHYSYGSKYSTEYWNMIKEKSNNFFNKTPNGNEDILLSNMVTDLMYNDTTFYSKIGCFTSKDIKQIHCGMTNENINDIIEKYQKTYFEWTNGQY